MALDIPGPLPGANMGWGCQMNVHSNDGSTATGDFAVARLFFLDGFGSQHTVCRGRGIFSASTNVAVVRFGLDGAGAFYSSSPTFEGLPPGSNVSVAITHTTAGFVFVESGTFADVFLWDPVSQAPDLVLGLASGGGHDPMLDDILAAVRRQFPLP